jgi:hypothetical protein
MGGHVQRVRGRRCDGVIAFGGDHGCDRGKVIGVDEIVRDARMIRMLCELLVENDDRAIGALKGLLEWRLRARLAKVMVVVEDLDLGRWLPCRPLIYPILQESFLLTALFICFHVVEHIVIGLVKGESLAASIQQIGGGGLAGLACVAAIFFIALIPFFAFKHVGRELGEHRRNAMLFGTAGKVMEGR